MAWFSFSRVCLPSICALTGPLGGNNSCDAFDWNLTADSIKRGCTAVHAPSKGSDASSILSPYKSKPRSNIDSHSLREDLSDS